MTESHLRGSQGISLVKTVQGAGDFSDPPTSDLIISYRRRGFIRGIQANGGAQYTFQATRPVFIVTPPDVASLALLEGQYELCLVGIPGHWAQSLLESHKALTSLGFGKLHDDIQEDKTVFRLLEHLHHKDTLEADNALLIDGLVTALLGRLVELADMKAKPRTIRPLDKVVVTHVQNYLQDHLSANPTLQDLASLVGVSVDHFGKSFKKATGQTPYQYLLEKRLDRAKELLKDSRLPLVDVALEVGFSSQAHLNKRFKERFAVTPGAYRKHLS